MAVTHCGLATSGLTQKAYCEHQELRYSTFGYWVRKLRRAAE
ncbi:IS66 family insertion sequence element accessory protein TnpA, partial [Thiolapillus sp.]